MFLFVNSNNLIMNDNLNIEWAKANKVYPRECTDTYEKIIYKIFSPNFIDCRIYIEDPKVIFRPWPW